MGQGAVGTVFAGIYNNEEVAIKIINLRRPLFERVKYYKCTQREVWFGQRLHAAIDYKNGLLEEGQHITEESTHMCACKFHCEYTLPHSFGGRPSICCH